MHDSNLEYKTGHSVISVNLCKENTLYIVCTHVALISFIFQEGNTQPK